MAGPKVHINDPTYTIEEVAARLDMEARHVKYIQRVHFPDKSELDWPTFAKLIIARRIHNAMPSMFKDDALNTWPAIVHIVMEGPVPRAGRAVIRPDSTIYYIAEGIMSTTKQPEGISVVWDGQLKV